MVDQNSPVFSAYHLTSVSAILFLVFVFCLFITPVNAGTSPITNSVMVADNNNWNHLDYMQLGPGYDIYIELPYYDSPVTLYMCGRSAEYSVGYSMYSTSSFDESTISRLNDPPGISLLESDTFQVIIGEYNSFYISDPTQFIKLVFASGDDVSWWGDEYPVLYPYISYASNSVEWNQSSYSVGDTGFIDYSIGGYDPGTYDYSIDIFEGSSFMSYCHLSSSEGNASYIFSDVVEPVTYYAKLTKRVNGSSVPLVITTDSCTVGPSDVSIVFNQSIYRPDDLVSISYYNCPDGSKIILQDDITPHQVSNTWVNISGNGSVSYQLSNADANRVFYAKVYSVSNIVLASDSMQIDDISSGYCQVHGGIYDSQDYHPLIGTVFIGDSYSDVVGYSDYGAYSIIVPWGTYDISAVVSSYLTHNISNVVISGSSYDLNMFLSVNDTTTHVFRGSVTDADSNAAIEDVLIKVYNDTFDEYDFTSQSGVWVVNGLTSGANYTLHATKDDYHSYTYSFMYDPGDFYHNFMMSSVVVEDDVIEDVLEDDETMTEYFDDKFREFAPTAWGIFLLSVVLWLMAILTSFGGSNKRR